MINTSSEVSVENYGFTARDILNGRKQEPRGDILNETKEKLDELRNSRGIGLDDERKAAEAYLSFAENYGDTARDILIGRNQQSRDILNKTKEEVDSEQQKIPTEWNQGPTKEQKVELQQRLNTLLSLGLKSIGEEKITTDHKKLLIKAAIGAWQNMPKGFIKTVEGVTQFKEHVLGAVGKIEGAEVSIPALVRSLNQEEQTILTQAIADMPNEFLTVLQADSSTKLQMSGKDWKATLRDGFQPPALYDSKFKKVIDSPAPSADQEKILNYSTAGEMQLGDRVTFMVKENNVVKPWTMECVKPAGMQNNGRVELKFIVGGDYQTHNYTDSESSVAVRLILPKDQNHNYTVSASETFTPNQDGDALDLQANEIPTPDVKLSTGEVKFFRPAETTSFPPKEAEPAISKTAGEMQQGDTVKLIDRSQTEESYIVLKKIVNANGKALFRVIESKNLPQVYEGLSYSLLTGFVIAKDAQLKLVNESDKSGKSQLFTPTENPEFTTAESTQIPDWWVPANLGERKVAIALTDIKVGDTINVRTENSYLQLECTLDAPKSFKIISSTPSELTVNSVIEAENDIQLGQILGKEKGTRTSQLTEIYVLKKEEEKPTEKSLLTRTEVQVTSIESISEMLVGDRLSFDQYGKKVVLQKKEETTGDDTLFELYIDGRYDRDVLAGNRTELPPYKKSGELILKEGHSESPFSSNRIYSTYFLDEVSNLRVARDINVQNQLTTARTEQLNLWMNHKDVAGLFGSNQDEFVSVIEKHTQFLTKESFINKRLDARIEALKELNTKNIVTFAFLTNTNNVKRLNQLMDRIFGADTGQVSVVQFDENSGIQEFRRWRDGYQWEKANRKVPRSWRKSVRQRWEKGVDESLLAVENDQSVEGESENLSKRQIIRRAIRDSLIGVKNEISEIGKTMNKEKVGILSSIVGASVAGVLLSLLIHGARGSDGYGKVDTQESQAVATAIATFTQTPEGNKALNELASTATVQAPETTLAIEKEAETSFNSPLATPEPTTESNSAAVPATPTATETLTATEISTLPDKIAPTATPPVEVTTTPADANLDQIAENEEANNFQDEIANILKAGVTKEIMESASVQRLEDGSLQLTWMLNGAKQSIKIDIQTIQQLAGLSDVLKNSLNQFLAQSPSASETGVEANRANAQTAVFGQELPEAQSQTAVNSSQELLESTSIWNYSENVVDRLIKEGTVNLGNRRGVTDAIKDLTKIYLGDANDPEWKNKMPAEMTIEAWAKIANEALSKWRSVYPNGEEPTQERMDEVGLTEIQRIIVKLVQGELPGGQLSEDIKWKEIQHALKDELQQESAVPGAANQNEGGRVVVEANGLNTDKDKNVVVQTSAQDPASAYVPPGGNIPGVPNSVIAVTGMNPVTTTQVVDGGDIGVTTEGRGMTEGDTQNKSILEIVASQPSDYKERMQAFAQNLEQAVNNNTINQADKNHLLDFFNNHSEIFVRLFDAALKKESQGGELSPVRKLFVEGGKSYDQLDSRYWNNLVDLIDYINSNPEKFKDDSSTTQDGVFGFMGRVYATFSIENAIKQLRFVSTNARETLSILRTLFAGQDGDTLEVAEEITNRPMDIHPALTGELLAIIETSPDDLKISIDWQKNQITVTNSDGTQKVFKGAYTWTASDDAGIQIQKPE